MESMEAELLPPPPPPQAELWLLPDGKSKLLGGALGLSKDRRLRGAEPAPEDA